PGRRRSRGGRDSGRAGSAAGTARCAAARPAPRPGQARPCSSPRRPPVQPAAVTTVAQPGYVIDLGVRPALTTVILTHFLKPPPEPVPGLAQPRASYSRQG